MTFGGDVLQRPAKVEKLMNRSGLLFSDRLHRLYSRCTRPRPTIRVTYL